MFFLNMNFGALFIILSNIQIHFVVDSKESHDENDNCSMCTISFFRRKRALSEYTRWRANPETTSAFIVKVLEDDSTIPISRQINDVTRPTTKQIVAVNIQPLKISNDKLIVDRATLLTSTETLDLAKEYTRFVPPTTLKLTRFDGDMVRPAETPIINDKVPPIKPKGKVLKGQQKIGPVMKFNEDRHLKRDESPPAGPQFIQRSNTEGLRQYAPIATILFTKQNTLGPLTPRTVDKFLLYKTTMHPTRTSPFSDILIPMRTSDFFNVLTLDDDISLINDKRLFPTRTTLQTGNYPLRTIKSSSVGEENDDDDDDNDEGTTTKDAFEVQRRKGIEKKKPLVTEPESYNIYNDDESETTTKKKNGQSESYDDNLESNTAKSLTKTSSLDDLEEYDNTTEIESNLDEEEEDNEKNGTTLTTRIQGVATIELTTKIIKETLRKNRTCNLIKLRQLSFNSPRTLHEITSQLMHWAEESPIAKWIDITDGNFTVMENPIYMMIIDDPSSGQIVSAKQTVMIVAGIQGRDHQAVAAAMYVLYQLIERNEAHSDLLTKYRFWIIPVFNPDGYSYSMTFPRRRDWTKNLKQTWDSCKGQASCQNCELHGIRCTIQPCYGVNLDRNFEYQWIPPEELRSEHPCGALYAGSRQLSEAETGALTHYLHEQKTPLYTFVAFKEGDVLGVMYPYSHTRKKRAFDHVYRQRASSAASAAYSISGRPYVAGQTSEFLPLYAGGIEDWVDGHLGIDNTYTVMMFRPTDSRNSKLITERVVHEAYAAVDTLLLQSVEPLGPPLVTITRSSSHITTPPFIIYFIMYTLLFDLLE